MGGGIAKNSAYAKFRTHVKDTNADAIESSRQRIRNLLLKAKTKVHTRARVFTNGLLKPC